MWSVKEVCCRATPALISPLPPERLETDDIDGTLCSPNLGPPLCDAADGEERATRWDCVEGAEFGDGYPKSLGSGIESGIIRGEESACNVNVPLGLRGE